MILQARYQGFAFAMLTIAFWSTVATAFKLSLNYLSFIPLVFYASLVSTLMLALLCGYNHKFSELSGWQTADYLRSLLLGAFNPALYYMVLFRAYELLPAQEAQVLNFSWPIVLTLLGVLFLKQRLSMAGLLAIAVSFLGVAIIATRGQLLALNFSNTLGVALALASTLIWAGYWVISQTDKRDPLLRLLFNFAAGTVWMAVIMTLSGQWQFPGVYGFLGAVYIGLFEMSLAFFCWFQALRLSNNISLLNNLIFLTPFGSLLVISWVLKEPISISTLLGLGLITASILMQKLASRG